MDTSDRQNCQRRREPDANLAVDNGTDILAEVGMKKGQWISPSARAFVSCWL
jgi:hypothetical protein